MADRREEIIQAGIEIFSKKGYYNTHIADIVKVVGIAKGTFYLYFKSKKSLFITLIERFEQIFSNVFNFDQLKEKNNLKFFLNDLLRKIFELYKKKQKSFYNYTQRSSSDQRRIRQ